MLPFNAGISPDNMKIANVRPLFKMGDRQDARNYRISTLSTFSKYSKILCMTG